MRLLIEETNIDIIQTNNNGETPIHLACKNGVEIEILERLLVSMRGQLTTEEIKEYLSKKDDAGMVAIEYSKIKKRTDLLAILDEFADFNKQVLDIEFVMLDEDYKSKFHSVYQHEIHCLKNLNSEH